MAPHPGHRRAGATRPEDVLNQCRDDGGVRGAAASLADVMDSAATNHAAIVQALEMMTAPVITVAQCVRSATDTNVDKSRGAKGNTTGKEPQKPQKPQKPLKA